eukprot:TRINITY_DN972_c0_g2_i1.p1 TRINITY_DN972_c0_g2~~TRINITY_DN972_c0_g2_i1.p1  ORF type:complete len:230 (-),score=47.49 TRINITY_DN972_c0_g2_i1:216-905(-)
MYYPHPDVTASFMRYYCDNELVEDATKLMEIANKALLLKINAAFIQAAVELGDKKGDNALTKAAFTLARSRNVEVDQATFTKVLRASTLNRIANKEEQDPDTYQAIQSIVGLYSLETSDLLAWAALTAFSADVEISIDLLTQLSTAKRSEGIVIDANDINRELFTKIGEYVAGNEMAGTKLKRIIESLKQKYGSEAISEEIEGLLSAQPEPTPEQEAQPTAGEETQAPQ